MTDLEVLEIETVIRLLSETTRPTFQARYEDCIAITARHLKDGSEFLFALIKAAVGTNVHQTNLINDVVSFLDDADLARSHFSCEVRRNAERMLRTCCFMLLCRRRNCSPMTCWRTFPILRTG
jgi:hypothetical protein